jgi:hypothetical protein
VNDTVVGEDIKFHSSLAFLTLVFTHRDVNSTALKSLNHETVLNLTRDKDARKRGKEG